MRRAARNTVTMRSMFCEEVHTKIARVAQAAAVGLHEQRVRVERAVVHQQRRDPERSDLERALVTVEARILEPVSVGHVPGRRLEDAVQGEGVDSVLHQYHGEPLRAPPHARFPLPDPVFLAWHRKEVFRVPEIVR